MSEENIVLTEYDKEYLDVALNDMRNAAHNFYYCSKATAHAIHVMGQKMLALFNEANQLVAGATIIGTFNKAKGSQAMARLHHEYVLTLVKKELDRFRTSSIMFNGLCGGGYLERVEGCFNGTAWVESMELEFSDRKSTTTYRGTIDEILGTLANVPSGSILSTIKRALKPFIITKKRSTK